MDFNPLAKEIPALQSQLDRLRESERQITDELHWYSTIDANALAKELLQSEAAAEKLQFDVAAIGKEIRENAALIAETESARETLVAKCIETTKQIELLQESEKQVAAELEWYRNTDPRSLAEDLSGHETSVEKLRAGIVVLEKEIEENFVQLGEAESAVGTIFNPLNWFAKEQVKVRRERKELRDVRCQKGTQRDARAKELESTLSQIAILSGELHRYGTFDLTERQTEAEQLKNALAGKKVEESIANEGIASRQEALFRLREIGKERTAQEQSYRKELEDVRALIATMTSDLLRHQAFDLARRQNELSQLKRSIEAKARELKVVAERKRRIDELLQPLIEEMKNLDSRKRHAQLNRDSAQELDRRLSNAANSYEKAMVHEECERKFGKGSPRRIVGDSEREIQQVERDYVKARRRVEDIAVKAARKISTVVIDGNNLCYEGGAFIGLAAIETLVPLLVGIPSVIVVFDSAIRRMLRSDDSEIQKQLGDHAKVHIVASRQLADETILDLASPSSDAYVLSNDRFGDFNEKAVVREGRTIRHEIVNGNIFVHDLQLRAAFLAETT